MSYNRSRIINKERARHQPSPFLSTSWRPSSLSFPCWVANPVLSTSADRVPQVGGDVGEEVGAEVGALVGFSVVGGFGVEGFFVVVVVVVVMLSRTHLPLYQLVPLPQNFSPVQAPGAAVGGSVGVSSSTTTQEA